jgi:hypothetical protein
MFGFDFYIFIWPDDFYRKSSTLEGFLSKFDETSKFMRATPPIFIAAV